MDPLTQGALGAAVAQLAVGRRLGRRTWLYGCLGGLAADLDIFIRSATDPMVGIEYHRHFTHSLAFIPVGGVIVALPWLLRSGFTGKGRLILAATTVGYATHGILDCCTSYGTMWLWPFSDMRVAWSFISIIDLLYTVPLLVGVWLSARSRAGPSGSLRPVAIGFAIAHLYMAACGIQKLRALGLRDQLAAERGHVVERSFVQNLLMTNIAWRSIYLYEGRIYADAVYTPWFGPSVVREGESRTRGREGDLPPEVVADPRTRRGFEVFSWFASDWYLVESEGPAAKVCDVRYSVDPAGFAPFWCAALDPGAPTPVARTNGGVDRSDRVGGLLNASFFPPEDARTLP